MNTKVIPHKAKRQGEWQNAENGMCAENSEPLPLKCGGKVIHSQAQDQEEWMSEEAKAVQETAKAVGKALDVTREAGGWLDRIFGRAVEDTVGRLWTDRISARRIEAAIYDWERLQLLAHNVDRRLREAGVRETRAVPPKIAFPLLEHATMEHEEELHELWERLFASALDPSQEEIKRTYVSVLAELSGKDARLLKTAYAEWWYYESREIPDYVRPKEGRYSAGIEIGDHETTVLFYRLGLVLPIHIPVEEYADQTPVTINETDRDDPPYYVRGGEKAEVLGSLRIVAFTEFGEKFCRAVIGSVEGLYEPPERFKEYPRKGG